MKILTALFWFMLGGTVAVMLVNFRIIAANVGDLTTPGGIAVYNLHDHLLPYAIFFIASTFILLLVILAVMIVGKLKRK